MPFEMEHFLAFQEEAPNVKQSEYLTALQAETAYVLGGERASGRRLERAMDEAAANLLHAYQDAASYRVELEWSALTRFVIGNRPGIAWAVLLGRQQQPKGSKFKLTMGEAGRTVRLKYLAKIATNFEDADFWLIRRHGRETVGKPVRDFNREHIGIRVERTDVLDPDYLYYMLEALWMSGYWQPLARGSLRLQHITVADVRDLKFG